MTVYNGEIDYFSQQPELHLLNHTLHTDPTLRKGRGAVVFWFEKFINYVQLYTDAEVELVSFNGTKLAFPTDQETHLAIQKAQLGRLPIIVNNTQFYSLLCEFLDSAISAEVTGDIVKTVEQEPSSCGSCCILVS